MTNLTCRYSDCLHPEAQEDEQVTCPLCRANLGLEALAPRTVRELAHDTADLAAESATCDLPSLIEGACKEAMISTLRDPIIRAALNGYIDSLREEIEAHPERPGLPDYLAKALALAVV